ncbi:MAG: hypothetical protein ACTSYS_13865 [Promethearchaeota archaeon]
MNSEKMRNVKRYIYIKMFTVLLYTILYYSIILNYENFLEKFLITLIISLVIAVTDIILNSILRKKRYTPRKISNKIFFVIIKSFILSVGLISLIELMAFDKTLPLIYYDIETNIILIYVNKLLFLIMIYIMISLISIIISYSIFR